MSNYIMDLGRGADTTSEFAQAFTRQSSGAGTSSTPGPNYLLWGAVAAATMAGGWFLWRKLKKRKPR